MSYHGLSNFNLFVSGLEAQWTLLAPTEAAGPLHHPPNLLMEGSNMWSWSVPLSVLASGSLLGCSPADQYQASLLPVLSFCLGPPLSLSFLTHSLSPFFPPSMCLSFWYLSPCLYLCLFYFMSSSVSHPSSLVFVSLN